MRWFVVSALLLTAAGCTQETKQATAIAVSVKTDLALGTELGSIAYRVFPVEGDPSRDQPVAQQTATAAQLSLPFIILKNEDEEVLVAVQGFSPTDQAIVEHRVRAHFEAGKTIEVPVYLGKSCVKKGCTEVPEQTCHAEARYGVQPGSCGAIPAANPVVITDPDEVGKWDPVLGQGDGGVDGGPVVCASGVDAGTCDPIEQCGCPADQHCQVGDGGMPGCAPNMGMKVRGEQCQAPSQCGPGLSCGYSVCTNACRSSEDCGKGFCLKTGEAPYGTCLLKCEAASDCGPGTPCSALKFSDVQGTYCWKPFATCKRSDNSCGEPGIGNGLCAAGTDPEDCACDPVKRTNCSDGQTCMPKFRSTTTLWDPVCVAAGSKGHGSACSTWIDCQVGLGCYGGVCTYHCDTTETPTKCPSSGPCVAITMQSGMQSIAITPRLGACLIPCTSNAQCTAPAFCNLGDAGTGFCHAF